MLVESPIWLILMNGKKTIKPFYAEQADKKILEIKSKNL
jgi:hypothetical protein